MWKPTFAMIHEKSVRTTVALSKRLLPSCPKAAKEMRTVVFHPENTERSFIGVSEVGEREREDE